MLKLTLPEVKKEPKEAEQCPICKGRRLIRHQTIFKPVKDSILKEVTIKRILCKNCHYTFRIYPEGVKEGSARTKRLVFLGVILYLAGLSYEKCEWFLEGILGKKLVDMVTIWRDIQKLGKKLRRKNLSPNVGLIVGIDGTYFKVKGEVVPTIFATNAKKGVTIWFDFRDERDKAEIKGMVEELTQLCKIEAVITDDWELYKELFEEKRLLHQVCLAHMRRNFRRRLSRIKKGALDIKEKLIELVKAPNLSWEALCEIAKDERLWLKENVKLRMIIAALIRKWKYYTAYKRNVNLPLTNNITERAILPSKVRYKTTRGLKNISGLANFITMTQIFGRQGFGEIAESC